MTLNNVDSTDFKRNIDEDYRMYDESKNAYLLYNGAIQQDEDLADYYKPIKAVKVG